ncbi:MAG: Hpt domain-containing protein, partial [Chitinispirillia bacterium]|nr:Hpt domain-containing protein [Chitinispirillia bacterium]MCL2267562.1 Hpt domain-containing protein [Chitinispirillia bacterium]
MSSDEVRGELEKLEEISAALILLDPKDNQALAGIHTKFQALHDAFADDAPLRDLAAGCVKTIESAIFVEIEPAKAVETLSQALTVLRRKIMYGDEAPADEGAPADDGVDGGAADGAPPADMSGMNFDMDAKEDVAPPPPPPPLKQDADGFFVDVNAPKKSTHKAFRKQIDLGTLDTSLLGEFIAEAEEHLANADDAMLRLEAAPADVDIINELFRVFHTIKGVAGFLALDAIQTLTHSTESLMDKAREKVFVLTEPAMDLVFTTIDVLKKEIGSLKSALEGGTMYVVEEIMEQVISSVDAMLDSLLNKSSPPPKLGEILVEEGKVTPAEMTSVLSEQERRPDAKVGEILVDRGVVTPDEVSQALDKQVAAAGKPAQPHPAAAVVKESVKVDTDKLDKLVDMIGELVITEAMVTDELTGSEQSTRLGTNARQLRKITRQLQEIGLSMRMMSLKATFNKMARMVRDLAKKANKEIEFVSIGEDTELDKSVIEHISDPLVHMIRNSADHGLEGGDEREAAGKPRQGTVTLKAY